jgi:hypothetical protein
VNGLEQGLGYSVSSRLNATPTTAPPLFVILLTHNIGIGFKNTEYYFP